MKIGVLLISSLEVLRIRCSVATKWERYQNVLVGGGGLRRTSRVSLLFGRSNNSLSGLWAWGILIVPQILAFEAVTFLVACE